MDKFNKMSKNNLHYMILTVELVTIALISKLLFKNILYIYVIGRPIFLFYTFFLMLISISTGSFFYSCLGILIFNFYEVFSSLTKGFVLHYLFSIGFSWYYILLHFLLNILVPNFVYLVFIKFSIHQKKKFNYYQFGFYLFLSTLVQALSYTLNNYFIWFRLSKKAIAPILLEWGLSNQNDFLFFSIMFIVQIITLLLNNLINFFLFLTFRHRLEPFLK